MKAQVAVDSRSRVFRTVLVSPVNMADRDGLPSRLHGRETQIWSDQATQGQTEVIRRHAPAVGDCTSRHYRQTRLLDERIKTRKWAKARVQTKVEHSFGVVKRGFSFEKVLHRGLATNMDRLEVTVALANLFMVGRQLLQLQV
jgi:IS5 family transposase